MKLLICGSRSITDYATAKRLIEKGLAEFKVHVSKIKEVVSGGAIGLDKLGEQWATEKSIPIKVFKPDWSLGKRAGPLRNIEMCEYVGKSGLLICVHDGMSKGALQCYNYGKEIGLRTIKYVLNTNGLKESL